MTQNHVQHQSHISKLLFENLEKQRIDNLFSDFLIKTQDGGEFKVHRNVLAATCSFFFTYFQNETKMNSNNYCGCLEMVNISSSTLKNILEYLYTGETIISSEISEIKELLDNALYLGLDKLVDTCTQMLIKSVNKDTCCDLLKYSHSYHLGDDLKTKCDECIITNINTINELKNFHKLSFELIDEILSAPRELNNHVEEELYLATERWIIYDFDDRQQYIKKLFDKINFDLLSKSFVNSKIFNHGSLLKSSSDFINKMSDLSEKLNEISMKADSESNASKKLCKISNFYTVIDMKLKKFDCSETKFHVNVEDIQQTAFGYTIFQNENLFICGGGTYDWSDDKLDMFNRPFNSSKYYSFSEMNWKHLPCMIHERYLHRAVPFENKIYVCGGFEQNTTEIFDLHRNCWQIGPSLNKIMISFGLCIHDKCIYAMSCDNFQRLDPRENSWITLPKPPFSNWNTAVTYEDYIYGFDTEGVHKFDVRSNKWCDSSKSYDKKYLRPPHACVIDDKIYVLGRTQLNKATVNVYNATDLRSNNYFEINFSKYIYGLINVNHCH